MKKKLNLVKLSKTKMSKCRGGKKDGSAGGCACRFSPYNYGALKRGIQE